MPEEELKAEKLFQHKFSMVKLESLKKSNQFKKALKEKKVHLELCLTSNIVTKVYNNYNEHPIDKLYNNGISISINSDGRAPQNQDRWARKSC